MRFWDLHRLRLQPDNVPSIFHAYIPLAEKWGICYLEGFDNTDIHDILLEEATQADLDELVHEVKKITGFSKENIYDYWLAKEKEPITLEYLAFTNMLIIYSDSSNHKKA
jgi:hypothetical protein